MGNRERLTILLKAVLLTAALAGIVIADIAFEFHLIGGLTFALAWSTP